MLLDVRILLGGAVPFTDVWAMEITLHPEVLPRLLRVKPPYDVTANGACVGPLAAILHTQPLGWTQGLFKYSSTVGCLGIEL